MSAAAQPPDVTVVIPVWDPPYTDTVEQAVRSVRSQAPTTPIIVVDNASETELPALQGADVVRAPRRLSAGAARNLGLERVRTEYVMFVDADDELLEGALAAVRERIHCDPTVSVAAMSLLEADTGKRHRHPSRFVTPLSRFPRLFALATSLWSLYATQACAIYRTTWVRDSGGYGDLSGPEDWVLAVSQAFRGRVLVDRQPGCLHHSHAASLTHGGIDWRLLLSAARLVRERLAADPAVPKWAKAMLPLIAIVQTMLILMLRPAYRSVRDLLG